MWLRTVVHSISSNLHEGFVTALHGVDMVHEWLKTSCCQYSFLSVFALLGCDRGAQLDDPARPAYVSDTTTDCANQCAEDPVADLLEHIDTSPKYKVSYSTQCGNESGVKYNDQAEHFPGIRRARKGHRQGIQRIDRNGKTYLLTSYNLKSKGEPIDGGIEVIDMSGGDEGCGPIGDSTAGCPVHVYKDPNFYHGGGLSTYGRWVALSVDNPRDEHSRAGIRLLDFANPENPVAGDVLVHEGGSASAALTRLSNGRYLAVSFRSDHAQFYTTQTEHFSLSSEDWVEHDEIELPDEWPDNFPNEYQGTQFLSNCDGELYLVGTYHKQTVTQHKENKGWSYDLVETNEAEVWRLTFTKKNVPVFTFVGAREYECGTGKHPQCDFNAGAGTWTDTYGNVYMYGVEYFNQGEVEGVAAVRLYEFTPMDIEPDTFMCDPGSCSGDCEGGLACDE
jgi:hypothetical protein